MKKYLFPLAFDRLWTTAASAQVGINNSTPDQSAVLDLSSSSKGLLLPRMTAAERTAIASPATGLMVYQTDGAEQGFWYFMNAGGWTFLSPTGADNLGDHTATQTLNLASQELNSTATGNANLVPLAYAVVDIGAVVPGSSTSNIQVAHVSTGRSRITVPGYSGSPQLDFAAVLVTVFSNNDGPRIATTGLGTASNSADVFIYNQAGTLMNAPFQAIIYTP